MEQRDGSETFPYVSDRRGSKFEKERFERERGGGGVKPFNPLSRLKTRLGIRNDKGMLNDDSELSARAPVFESHGKLNSQISRPG
jgi:hypothetical protein